MNKPLYTQEQLDVELLKQKNNTMPNFLSVKKFCQKHTSFSEGGLRNLIFHKEKNGLMLEKAIVKVGKRVLIDEERFFLWIKSLNE